MKTELSHILLLLSLPVIIISGCSTIKPAHVKDGPAEINFYILDANEKKESVFSRGMPLPGMGFADIMSAETGMSPFGGYMIQLKFTDTGAEKLKHITKKYSGRKLVIVLNRRVLAHPVIREIITGNEVVITGRFSHEEADRIVHVINQARPNIK